MDRLIQGVLKHRIWKLHSDCQVTLCHAPGSTIFAATGDSGGGGQNGLRKVPIVLSPRQSRSSEHRWIKEDTGSVQLGEVDTWHGRSNMGLRGDHCKPNPEVWLSTSFPINPNSNSSPPPGLGRHRGESRAGHTVFWTELFMFHSVWRCKVPLLTCHNYILIRKKQAERCFSNQTGWWRPSFILKGDRCVMDAVISFQCFNYEIFISLYFFFWLTFCLVI